MLAVIQAKLSSSDPSLAPRWLVTNGTTTVGPVHTELLLRGYMGGRIPEHCQVRDVRWESWRALDGIREIGNLKRRLARDHQRPLNLRDAALRLPRGETGEVLTAALALAVETLDASAGLIHRYRSPVPLPVTSSVFGVPVERLGEVLPSSDPCYALALRGKSLCGSPRHGVAERVLAERLQWDAPLASVTMTPIRASGRLLAMLELGRTGHPFRTDDAGDLSEFAAEIVRRIG